MLYCTLRDLFLIRRIAFLATMPGDTNDSQYADRVYQLFESARIYNKAHDINGAFLVRDNNLLLIIEGKASDLAKVTYQMGRDPRIADLSVVINRDTPTALFNRWAIKLLNNGHDEHTTFLAKLQYALNSQLEIRAEADRARLAAFFLTPPRHHNADTQPMASSAPSQRYQSMLLSMKSWPRPTQLRLTADLIKLCPLLIGHQVSYQRLLDLNIFASEEKLLEQLRLLDDVQALELSPLPANASLHKIGDQTPVSSSSPSSTFSQALRRFIQARTSGGAN